MDTGLIKAAQRVKLGKYLTLTLAGETYGIEVASVKEIVSLLPITPVPNTPNFISGVINLRGKIIPVIDLSTKFKMSQREVSRNTCIVVVEVACPDGRLVLGVVVESVQDVIDVASGDVEEIPAFGVRVDTSFLLGLARTKTGVCLLLDIEKVLNHDELEDARAAQATSAAKS